MMESVGPRLHHFAYVAASVGDLYRSCDLAGQHGYGRRVERGPGTHPGGTEGMSISAILTATGSSFCSTPPHHMTDMENEPVRLVPVKPGTEWDFLLGEPGKRRPHRSREWFPSRPYGRHAHSLSSSILASNGLAGTDVRGARHFQGKGKTMVRLNGVRPEAMSDRQREVADEIISGPRKRLAALMALWLHSPDLAEPAQRIGAYFRQEPGLPRKAVEMIILVTARHWQCAYEWVAHQAVARKEGLDEKIIEAIRFRQRPAFAEEAMQALHDFTRSMLDARDTF